MKRDFIIMKNMCSFLLLFLLALQVIAQEGPDPCGPANGLNEDFSKNVAENSRCFELRFYTADPAVNGKEG